MTGAARAGHACERSGSADKQLAPCTMPHDARTRQASTIALDGNACSLMRLPLEHQAITHNLLAPLSRDYSYSTSIIHKHTAGHMAVLTTKGNSAPSTLPQHNSGAQQQPLPKQSPHTIRQALRT